NALQSPFWKESRNRIAQLEEPALVELHQPNRSNGLRHREEAHDRIVPPRLVALDIHAAERLLISEHAAPPDRDLAAGNLLRLDVVAEQVFGDALETRVRKACVLSFQRHQTLRRGTLTAKTQKRIGVLESSIQENLFCFAFLRSFQL